ncbi:hypothetical protein GCM10029964_059880 [Kibdelosporangium lantanae]
MRTSLTGVELSCNDANQSDRCVIARPVIANRFDGFVMEVPMITAEQHLDRLASAVRSQAGGVVTGAQP